MPTCMSVYHLHFSYLLSDSLEMELKMVVGFYVDVGNHSRPLRKGISALYCWAFAPVPQSFAHHRFVSSCL